MSSTDSSIPELLLTSTDSSSPEERATSTDPSTPEEPLTHFPGITSFMTTLHHPPTGVQVEQKAAETDELTLKSVQHIAQLPVVQEASSMYFRLKVLTYLISFNFTFC